MSMFKKTFSSTYVEELSEVYTFLVQNASAYFDEIRINPNLSSEIQCITNLGNGEQSIFVVGISGLPELPTARCSMAFGSTKTGYSYSYTTAGQTPLAAGYVCSHGIALAMETRIRGDFMWVFITKTEDGDTLIFMPYVYNAQLYAWGVVPAHPEIQLFGTMLGVTGNQVQGWTWTSDAISLTGMPFRDLSAAQLGDVEKAIYSPYLYRVSYSPFSPGGSTGAHGKLTVNGVDFITNGYVALED